ncbi:MAG: hypothetical protein GX759_07140, partial [Thermoanaerobacterales bacterium]|nr:hypothetical protein [Thermoanaerobacterales bacterium]
HNITPQTIIKPVREVLRPVDMVVKEEKVQYQDKEKEKRQLSQVLLRNMLFRYKM